MEQCTFQHNSALGSGGAVFVHWGAAAQATRCHFSNNTAGGNGSSGGGARGGALFSAGTLAMHDCSFMANQVQVDSLAVCDDAVGSPCVTGAFPWLEIC
jgi:hypothetical protein